MSEMGIVFTVIVVMTFLVQAFNYQQLGKGRVNRYTWLFVLAGFVVTESMIAVINPVYSLYVLLTLWGIYHMWGKGKWVD